MLEWASNLCIYIKFVKNKSPDINVV